MKIVYFSGNFGNQIFYCAFKDYLLKKYPEEKVYYGVFKRCPPIKVQKYTSLELPRYSRALDIISNLLVCIDIVLRKMRLKLPSSLVCGDDPITEDSFVFSHYLQNKYFYADLDSGWLNIEEPAELSEQYRYFKKLIVETDSICIHIRRGDYVNNPAFVDLSGTDYYEKAIYLAKQRYPKGKLFFFSDDLEYVKNRFKGNDCYYVDCNRGSDSYLDMKLMAFAKVNIIANSTFSYWAAYIGNEHKVVLYPSKWFKENTPNKDPDIFLDSWEMIEV